MSALLDDPEGLLSTAKGHRAAVSSDCLVTCAASDYPDGVLMTGKLEKLMVTSVKLTVPTGCLLNGCPTRIVED
jgi:hypothetical protein